MACEGPVLYLMSLDTHFKNTMIFSGTFLDNDYVIMVFPLTIPLDQFNSGLFILELKN